MTEKFRKHLTTLLITIFLVVLAANLLQSFYEEIHFRHFWLITFVLVAGSVFSAFLVEVAFHGGSNSFVQLSLLSSVLRLTIYALLLFVMIYFTDANIKQDIVYFAIFYLILTLHEIIIFLKRG